MISQADVDLDKFGSFETQKVTNLKLQTNCNSSPTVNAFWKIQIIKLLARFKTRGAYDNISYRDVSNSNI